VVAIHHLIVLDREDTVQIPLDDAHKRMPWLGGADCEATMELRDIVLPQEVIGRLDRADSCPMQLRREPPLPRPEVAFSA
jgi:hypothetical protein